MSQRLRINQARSDFLKEYWDYEVLTYKFAMADSPQLKHK